MSHRILSPALAGGTLHDLFPYPLFWALISLYHLPANQKTPPSHIAASSILHHETGVDIQTTAVLSFSKIGAQATLSASLQVPTPKDQVVLIQGTRGDLVIPLIPPGRPTKYYLRIRKSQERNAEYYEVTKEFEIPGGWLGSFKALFGGLINIQGMDCSGKRMNAPAASREGRLRVRECRWMRAYWLWRFWMK